MLKFPAHRLRSAAPALLSLLALQLALPPAASAARKLASVYCPVLLDPQTDPDLMFRLEMKSRMRMTKGVDAQGRPLREVSIVTNIDRRARQMGGHDESADASAPLVLLPGDPLLKPGMEPGVYWTNSGKYFFRTESIARATRGGRLSGKKFEIVYQYRTEDGRILRQTGGYADADSSWGWDGRFEIQVDDRGREELVITQGAMPLVDGKLPQMKSNNNMRGRRVFKIEKFEDGKLYVMDQGNILGHEPDLSGDWIQYETVKGPHGEPVNVLKSAHGYGENFIPDANDPRRMWKDEYGYTVRIFDMVVEEAHVRWPDGRIDKIPTKTRGIAFRMDPKNPSRRVPAGTLLPNGQAADRGVVIVSEAGSSGEPVKSTLRMQDPAIPRAEVLEVRTMNMDGTVTVEKNPARRIRVSLVEGFNPVPGVVRLPNGKEYYLGTFSASEYTWGGRLANGEKPGRYGAYLGFRPKSEGPLGQYAVASSRGADGLEDFTDFLEDFSERYGFAWGAGRPQAFQDEFGRWWMDVHAVDGDLLRPDLPKAGFPPNHSQFADGYRRHKIRIPIKWVEKNGQPAFEIDDPEIVKQIRAYRRAKAEAAAAKTRASLAPSARPELIAARNGGEARPR